MSSRPSSPRTPAAPAEVPPRPGRRGSRPRRVAEWAVPALAVTAMVAASLVAADRVPSPMAVHWGPGGDPDGAGALGFVTVVMVALVGGLGSASLWAVRSAPSRRAARAIVASVLGSAGFFLAVHLLMLRANSGAPSWEQAETLTAGDVLLVPVLAAVALGALGWWLAGDRPDPERTAYAADEVPLAPGEAVVWTGQATGAAAVLLPFVLVAVAAVLWAAAPSAGVAGVATGLVVLAILLGLMLRIRVTVGPGGLTVTFGPLAWPRLHVPLADIEAVHVERVEPMAYGGWGYRVVPGARALVVRRGEGVRLERRGRSDLVVTVEEARTAAGVLLAHLGAPQADPRP